VQRAGGSILAARGENRIGVKSQAGNPFTQGYARADTDFKVGDFYRYRVLDLETRSEKRVVPGIITAVTDAEVTFGKSVLVLDRMGNTLRTDDGYRYTDNPNMPLEFYVGRNWTTQYRSFPPGLPDSARITIAAEYRIVGREAIQVPAGTFDCFRIEGRGRIRSPVGTSGELRITTWFAPDRCRRHIAQELVRRPAPGALVAGVAERYELLAFRQS
jgi:hypothetical protein